MVTSVIGKIFLETYNQQKGTDYSPREFFLEVYYPLFYDHEKYLMTAGNSPLENPKISWKEMLIGKASFETKEMRAERLTKFINRVDSEPSDASIAVGYPTVDQSSTTSGQITQIERPVDPSESYLSWIGAGLGVGVKGGLSILFNHSSILMDIFEGWSVYRILVNSIPSMSGNQVNTWNAQWLKKKYDTTDSSTGYGDICTEDKGILKVNVLPWAELLVAICKGVADPKMMGYIYNIGQTNTTIGFIPFALSPIRRARELYVRYFGADTCPHAMKLFGSELGFSTACAEGAIGLKALEPKGLKKYMTGGQIPKYTPDQEEKLISFQTYQIWLLAMLNNEELWNKARNFASAVQTYSTGGKSGRTGRSQRVNQLLESSSKKSFINNLTAIIAEAEECAHLVEIASLINGMPSDNVTYFLTLIRFHYAVINNPNQSK